MDKDRIKGKIEDAKGRAKRQAGEWTDNPDLQAEGTRDQIKGKAENAIGQAKDAAREATDRAQDEADRLRGKADRKLEEQRERDRKRRAA